MDFGSPISESFLRSLLKCRFPGLIPEFLIQKFRQWAKELAFSVSSSGNFYAHRSIRTPVSEIIMNGVRGKWLHCQEGTAVQPMAFMFSLLSIARFFCLILQLGTLIRKLKSFNQNTLWFEKIILLHIRLNIFFPVGYIPNF